MNIAEGLGLASNAQVSRVGPEEPSPNAVRLELGGLNLAMDAADMVAFGLEPSEAGLRGLAAGVDPADLPGLGPKFGKYLVQDGDRRASIWVRTAGRAKPRASVLHLEDLGPAASPARADVDRVLDVRLDVTVVLGETDMELESVARLADGSVVQLDTYAGDPALILVQGRPYALGEVLVVDDQYAVRVTELLQDASKQGTG